MATPFAQSVSVVGYHLMLDARYIVSTQVDKNAR